jgi:hypothetical protein
MRVPPPAGLMTSRVPIDRREPIGQSAQTGGLGHIRPSDAVVGDLHRQGSIDQPPRIAT